MIFFKYLVLFYFLLASGVYAQDRTIESASVPPNLDVTLEIINNIELIKNSSNVLALGTIPFNWKEMREKDIDYHFLCTGFLAVIPDIPVSYSNIFITSKACHIGKFIPQHFK